MRFRVRVGSGRCGSEVEHVLGSSGYGSELQGQQGDPNMSMHVHVHNAEGMDA